MGTRQRKEYTAEILSVGNELLIGHTLDTNSHWIAKQINQLGWVLERVTQLPDSLNAISSGVRESVSRKPRVLITLGGLGPTYDDMTLAGVARALERPLGLNYDALRLVKEHYRRLEKVPKLTKYRTKMGLLPRGARPLANPVGTAPGVMIMESPTTIFSLPGIPSEMKAIFRNSIAPFLKAFNAAGPKEIQIRIAGIIESALAPVLDMARKQYPGLYFKSHPRGKETGPRPLIILQIYNIWPESARRVDEAGAFVVTHVSNVLGRPAAGRIADYSAAT